MKRQHKKPYQKLINAIGFFTKFARLKKMSSHEFFSVIFGENYKKPYNPKWISTLIEVLERIPFDKKNDIITIFENASFKGTEKLISIIDLMVTLEQESKITIDQLNLFLKNLKR